MIIVAWIWKPIAHCWFTSFHCLLNSQPDTKSYCIVLNLLFGFHFLSFIYACGHKLLGAKPFLFFLSFFLFLLLNIDSVCLQYYDIALLWSGESCHVICNYSILPIVILPITTLTDIRLPNAVCFPTYGIFLVAHEVLWEFVNGCFSWYVFMIQMLMMMVVA